MNDKINILIEEYKKFPCGRDKLWCIVKQQHPEISRRFVAGFLENLECHQMHLPRKHFTESANVIVTKRSRERLQVDLIYVDKLKGYNNQVEYFLTCIDHFSGKAFVRTLTNRRSITV